MNEDDAATRLRYIAAVLQVGPEVEELIATMEAQATRVAELEAAGDALADAADALDIRPADAAPVDAAIAVWRDVR